MGQRRMFSKDIVRSDSFLDLPLTAQCLYFQLGMETDDRGYISNGKSIVRLIGATQGDLEMLILKKFLLVRHDGTLLLQKHFKTNNLIRTDRFHETNYKEDLSLLFYDENGNYTDRNTGKNVLGIPMVGKLETEDKLSQVKLSKDKISKDNIEIEQDITRYNQKELLEMLVKSNYLTINELQDVGYDEFLTDIIEIYGYVDTKVKVKYFCTCLTTLNINEIENKFEYFKQSILNSFKKINRG